LKFKAFQQHQRLHYHDLCNSAIFPSGLTRDGQRHLLFCGASDCEVHWREIADPF